MSSSAFGQFSFMSPDSLVSTAPKLRFSNINEGVGRVLTSDLMGNATWQNIPSYIGNWQVVGTNNTRGGFNNQIADGSSNTFLIGESNNATNGQYQFGLGWGLNMQGYATTTLGTFNSSNSGSLSNWVSTDPLLVIGNGQSNAQRSNALSIQKNGVVSIGISPNTSTSFRLRVGGSISASSTIQATQLRATNLSGSDNRNVCADASGNLIECPSSVNARTYNVSAMGFHPQISDGIAQSTFRRDISKNLASFSNGTKHTEAFMFAPVELPHGFELKVMTFHYLQNEGGSMTVRLVSVPKLTNASVVTEIAITSSDGVGIQEKQEAPSSPIIIDNDNYYYSLILESNSTWTGTNMAIRGVVFNETKK